MCVYCSLCLRSNMTNGNFDIESCLPVVTFLNALSYAGSSLISLLMLPLSQR